MSWTDLIDQAVGFLVDNVTWNQINGATGNLMEIKNNMGFRNIIPNSDAGRRTVWGTYMPERFGDTSGFTLDAGTVGSVASNLWTMGTVGATRAKWGLSVWRDMRASAQFKATDAAAAGVYDELFVRYTDSNNLINVYCNNGNFKLDKKVAGVTTNLATVAQALTTNNFYWLEGEGQGTSFVAKVYSSGAAAVAKSSATLLQTLTGTAADAALAAGYAAVESVHTTNAGAWGGLGTGDGGLYVEGWCPEGLGAPTFGGTLGGQAFGIDETADSGPIERQWTPRWYIPAASRTISHTLDTPDGSVLKSVAFVASAYLKVSGLGGSGVLARVTFQRSNSANASQGTTNIDDAGETSWTRKTTGAITTEVGTRRARITVSINPSSTATGTAYIDCLALEQGGAATAWRNAPADDGADLRYFLQTTSGNKTTSSGTMADIDSRDCAVDVFLPWDATVEMELSGEQSNSGVNSDAFSFTVDGANVAGQRVTADTPAAANANMSLGVKFVQRLAAGKHRIAAQFAVGAGTCTVQATTNVPLALLITVTRGK